MSGLLALLIQLIIGGLIFYLLYWGVGKIGLPEPVNKIAIAIIVIVMVLWLINLLLGLGGHAFVAW